MPELICFIVAIFMILIVLYIFEPIWYDTNWYMSTISTFHEYNTKNGIIVMSDNRYLIRNMNEINNRHIYLSYAVVINYLYAKAHNLQFIYYQYIIGQKNEESLIRQKDHRTCPHHGYKIQRASPWCKLLSVYDTLIHMEKDMNSHNFSSSSSPSPSLFVLFLDSDMVFININQSILKFISQTTPISTNINTNKNKFNICNNCFMVASDEPYSKDGNTALMWFHISPQTNTNNLLWSKCLLQEWWNVNEYSKYNYVHPYEQHVLNQGKLFNHSYYYYDQYKSIMNDHSLRSNNDDDNNNNNNNTLLWRHFTGIDKKLRIEGMYKILRDYYKVDPIQFEQLIDEIEQFHMLRIFNTSKMSIQLEHASLDCNSFRNSPL